MLMNHSSYLTCCSLNNKDQLVIGASPSGKAPVFGVGIRRFESYRPSQIF